MLVKELVDRSCPAISESASLKELVSIFEETDRTTLPVVDANRRLVGIVSLHDLVRHFLPRYMDLLPSLEFLGKAQVLEQQLLKQIMDPDTSRLFLVHDVMVNDFIAVNENDSTFKALALMLHKRYHHLPVVDSQMKYCGMIDQRQIILALMLRAIG
jgi:CBS domain-containing protein